MHLSNLVAFAGFVHLIRCAPPGEAPDPELALHNDPPGINVEVQGSSRQINEEVQSADPLHVLRSSAEPFTAVVLDQPSEPGQPGQGQLGQPAEPGQGQLGQPAEPGQPGQPSEPGQPEQPGQLNQPSQPGELNQPSQPGQLNQPSQPGQLNQPSQPGQLNQPSQPGQPSPTDQSAAPGPAWPNPAPILPVRHPDAPPIIPLNPPASDLRSRAMPGPANWGIADAERAGLIKGKELDTSKEGSCATCGPRNNFGPSELSLAQSLGSTTPTAAATPANSEERGEPFGVATDPEQFMGSRFEAGAEAEPQNPYRGYQRPASFYASNHKPRFGEITNAARDAILDTCRRIDCITDSPVAARKLDDIHRTEADVQRLFNPLLARDAVARRLAKTHRLKRQLLAAAGLDAHVQPTNDGTFQNDLLLTDAQAESMMLKLRLQTERRRHRRAAIYAEQMPASVWERDQAVPFVFDGSLSENERFEVRMALHAIESSTCIRFRNHPRKPSGNHIYFVKVATPTFCGLSYIGKVSPANPIYLSFMCGDTVGVAIHETMHALGVTHEHLRFDRDRYLDMAWDNINPQLYDYFSVPDQTVFTTYGVPFDYSSIMMYNPFTAAINRSRPSMKPVNDDGRKIQMMGQRKTLSERDIELLNLMYCRPKDCIDRNVFCGLWTLRGLCRGRAQSAWMQRHCRKSCGLC